MFNLLIAALMIVATLVLVHSYLVNRYLVNRKQSMLAASPQRPQTSSPRQQPQEACLVV